MKKHLAVLLALLLPVLAYSGGPTMLYDSQSVAAGAQIQTPVLDLGGFGGYQSLQIVIDNTSGTAMRQLTLEGCIDSSCGTVLDSVPLRLVAFGAAPTGSVYAPGRVRGYVGPNPPGGTSGVYQLFRDTSAVNTAINTGRLFTQECDEITAHIHLSGASAHTTNLWYWDAASTQRNLSNPTVGGGTFSTYTLAPGQGSVGVSSSAGLGYSVPESIQVDLNAVAAITGTIVVECRGRVPGTFSVQMVAPSRARVTLAAGGSGAARMTIYGL